MNEKIYQIFKDFLMENENFAQVMMMKYIKEKYQTFDGMLRSCNVLFITEDLNYDSNKIYKQRTFALHKVRTYRDISNLEVAKIEYSFDPMTKNNPYFYCYFGRGSFQERWSSKDSHEAAGLNLTSYAKTYEEAIDKLESGLLSLNFILYRGSL